MNEEMKMMINAIIEEMGRMENRINTRFERVDAHLDKIEQCLEAMQHEINA